MAPLLRLADGIDRLNQSIGRAVAWLVLALIAVQFALVLMSNIFRIGSIAMQESLLYINSLMFLAAAGYTLLKGGHVRVDIFYASRSPRYRLWVDLLGSVLLLLPVAGVLIAVGLPFVEASWAVREGSTEAAGLHAVFLLKSFILLFALTLALQGVSLIIRSAAGLAGKSS